MIISGGELDADMLEVRYDPATKEYQAPLQLKANNGLFIIDDMGRQKIEARHAIQSLDRPPSRSVGDYLSLGRPDSTFSVPFDLILILSTNISPTELADEAFLRRIGYKINFEFATKDQYEKIWRNTCEENGVVFDPTILEYVIEELHEKEDIPMLPCHPRGPAANGARPCDLPRSATTSNQETNALGLAELFCLRH